MALSLQEIRMKMQATNPRFATWSKSAQDAEVQRAFENQPKIPVSPSGVSPSVTPPSSITPASSAETASNPFSAGVNIPEAVKSVAPAVAGEAVKTVAPAAADALGIGAAAATPWLTAAGMGIGLVGGAFKAADEASQAKVDRADEEELMRMNKRTLAHNEKESDFGMASTGFNNFMNINQMAMKNNRNRAFRKALATGA
jgi:hypothetical protein